MPQLVKRGKWVYGRVVMSGDRYIRLPQEAWTDYNFKAGAPAVFVRGSATSGGFGLGTVERLAGLFATRMLGRSVFEEGRRVRVHETVHIRPWQSLYAIRGSARTLGMIERGPVFDAATAFQGSPECLTDDLP